MYMYMVELLDCKESEIESERPSQDKPMSVWDSRSGVHWVDLYNFLFSIK